MSTIVTIGGISAPDSDFTRQASSLVERVHSDALMNHVHRTWWFAEFLGRKRGLKYDREVVYLASCFTIWASQTHSPPISASRSTARMPRTCS